jgi:hypothetical protein
MPDKPPSQFDLMILPQSALNAPKRQKQRGHAAVPGTGPHGETCKTCAHYTLKVMAKAYRKCGLMHAHWTGGPGTDIRARDPACRRWEKKVDA